MNFFYIRWYDLLTCDINAWSLAEVLDPVVIDAPVSHSLSDKDNKQQMWPVNKNILNHSTALAFDLISPTEYNLFNVESPLLQTYSAEKMVP